MRYGSAQFESASAWLRLANYVLDFFGIMLLAVLLGLLAFIVFGESAGEFIKKTPDLVIGIVASLAYYVPLEAAFGRTPGKWITGTCVVDCEGNRPSLKQIAGRTFLRFIPFESFTFVGANKRGCHDRLSDTYVVKRATLTQRADDIATESGAQ